MLFFFTNNMAAASHVQTSNWCCRIKSYTNSWHVRLLPCLSVFTFRIFKWKLLSSNQGLISWQNLCTALAFSRIDFFCTLNSFISLISAFLSYLTPKLCLTTISLRLKLNNFRLRCTLLLTNVFFISGNFYFSFVSISLAYITIPKNKRKTKITWDKKLTTTYPLVNKRVQRGRNVLSFSSVFREPQ